MALATALARPLRSHATASTAYGAVPQSDPDKALMHLAEQMDRFHTAYDVYTEAGAAGNHFVALAKIGDLNSVDMDLCNTERMHSGATSIKCTFRNTTGENFGGWYFLNGVLSGQQQQPDLNFGDVAGAGVDLGGATQLTFWARGSAGGEKVEFFVGGVGRDAVTGLANKPYPDSTPRVPPIGTVTTLTTEWVMYTVDLSTANLSYVVGGFAWACTTQNNPRGAVFWIDDIKYNKPRQNEARFIQSYVTASSQSFDAVNRNAAFSYDNAIAMLAFMARGGEDDLRRAKLIGDAFVYALSNDRTFRDGRVRNAYQAGDLALPNGWTPNGVAGAVRMPTILTCDGGPSIEDRSQVSSHTASAAAVMIALLTYCLRHEEAQYLRAAQAIGRWIEGRRRSSGKGGYKAGFEGFDKPSAAFPTDPVELAEANTTDNILVYVAFKLLLQASGDPSYQDRIDHALNFITAMYDAGRGCFVAGTKDGTTLNADVLLLSNQALSVLAIPAGLSRFPSVLQCAEDHFKTTRDGFSGYDFNDDKDGVWFEGTAMMAVAYAKAGQAGKSGELISQLRLAQSSAPNANGKGIVAASHSGVSTGFIDVRTRQPVSLQDRLHIAATAWYALSELGVNPFAPAPAALPTITSVKVQGKKLLVAGENYGEGAVILINDREQKTSNDGQMPTALLIGKKAGKKIRAGDRVRVRNADSSLSNEIIYNP